MSHCSGRKVCGIVGVVTALRCSVTCVSFSHVRMRCNIDIYIYIYMYVTFFPPQHLCMSCSEIVGVGISWVVLLCVVSICCVVVCADASMFVVHVHAYTRSYIYMQLYVHAAICTRSYMYMHIKVYITCRI